MARLVRLADWLSGGLISRETARADENAKLFHEADDARIEAEQRVKARKFRCSFCHKTEDQVRKLCCGWNTCICDECATLAVETMKKDRD